MSTHQSVHNATLAVRAELASDHAQGFNSYLAPQHGFIYIIDLPAGTKRFHLEQPRKTGWVMTLCQYQNVDGGITIDNDSAGNPGPISTIDFDTEADNDYVTLMSLPHKSINGEHVWIVCSSTPGVTLFYISDAGFRLKLTVNRTRRFARRFICLTASISSRLQTQKS